MARNKKPKRRYDPARLLKKTRNLPNWADMFHVFNPIQTALDQLASGEYFEADGAPVLKDSFGVWCEISPCILGWNDCFARLCRNTNRPFNPEPLNKLATALAEGEELTFELIDEARKIVAYTQTVYRTTPAHVIREHSRAEEIAINFQNMGLAA